MKYYIKKYKAGDVIGQAASGTVYTDLGNGIYSWLGSGGTRGTFDTNTGIGTYELATADGRIKRQIKDLNINKKHFENITGLLNTVVQLPVTKQLEEQVLLPYYSPLSLDSILRQMFLESGFNPNAKSPAGAAGLMLIMAQTVDDYVTRGKNKKVTNPYDVATNIRMGIWSLDDISRAEFIHPEKSTDKRIPAAKVFASYNWGRGNVLQTLNKAKTLGYDIYNSLDWINAVDKKGNYLFPEETRNYMLKMLGMDNDFNKQYELKLKSYKGTYTPYIQDELKLWTPLFNIGGIIKKNKQKAGKSAIVFENKKKVGTIIIPKNITEDQAAGRKPIYSKNNYDYYMNGDGSVTKKLN